MTEQRRKSTFTNADVTSYERHFTAMSFVWVDGRGMISLAPIFDEFVNKEPKRGDNVFDYDSKMNFSMDAHGAIQLKSAIENLMENEELKMATISFGIGKNSRSISVFKPNTLKLSGKHHDNYILRFTIKKDDEEEKMYHIMGHANVTYKTMSNEETDDTLDVDMMLLMNFCDQLIQNSFSVSYHGARRAGSSGQASGERSGGRTRRAVEEEDGAEEDSAAKPARKAKAKLDDEFGD